MELSDFKTYVKRDFKRTDKDTELVQAYNDTIMWLSNKMAIGDYKFQSYVHTQVGVEDYALPSNIIHLFHPIRLLLGSGTSDDGFQLVHLSKDEYDARQPNPNRTSPATARPDSYTIWSKSILLTPVPDLTSYILEINWSKRPVDLSADDDTPELGDEWREILKWGTLERLYAGMQQWDMAAVFGSKLHDAEDQPIGILKDMLREEVSREGNAISHVKNNSL